MSLDLCPVIQSWASACAPAQGTPLSPRTTRRDVSCCCDGSNLRRSGHSGTRRRRAGPIERERASPTHPPIPSPRSDCWHLRVPLRGPGLAAFDSEGRRGGLDEAAWRMACWFRRKKMRSSVRTSDATACVRLPRRCESSSKHLEAFAPSRRAGFLGASFFCIFAAFGRLAMSGFRHLGADSTITKVPWR
jgi:hypothetical protein